MISKSLLLMCSEIAGFWRYVYRKRAIPKRTRFVGKGICFGFLLNGLGSQVYGIGLAPHVVVPIELHIKPNITVQKSRIYLQDVASCIGFEGLCDELMAIDLGASAIEAVPRRFTCQGIKKIIQVEFKDIDLKMNCPGSFVVNTLRRKLVKDPVTKVMDQWLLISNESLKSDQFKIVIKKIVWPNIEYPTFYDEVKLGEIDLSSLRRDYRRDVRLDIPIVLLSHEVGISPLTAVIKVSFEKQVFRYVANTDLNRGQMIEAKSLVGIWLPLSSLVGSRFVEAYELVNQHLVRNFKAGQVILLKDLVRTRAVNRGEVVNLRIISGGLVVMGKGKAQRSGAIGDEIEVRRTQSAKSVVGKVIGTRLVEVSKF